MRVRVLESPEAVARAAADIVCEAAQERPDLSLGLPTGRTTVPWYFELAKRFRSGDLDLSRARSFNLDELLLPEGHASSFRSFMERHSWQRIGLQASLCEIPGSRAEPMAECRRYDAALEASGALHLVFLGVGTDGHVAYNLPGQVEEGTHVVELPASLADSLDVPEDQRPLRAITVGLGMMRSARHLVLMATTASKVDAIRALLRTTEAPKDSEDSSWPCTLLREHDHFDVLLTRSAAGEAS